MKKIELDLTQRQYDKLLKSKKEKGYSHTSWACFFVNTCSKGISTYKDCSYKNEKINYQRNNSVKCRNFTEAVDFHDLVKTLLVRMIRRKHPRNDLCLIYTEFNEEKPNESYPDILVKIRQSGSQVFFNHVFELQDKVTQKWTDNIIKQYPDDVVVIVPLKEVYNKWENRMLNNLSINKIFEPIKELRKVLEDYSI